MVSSQPFPSGPPRPRPGYYPNFPPNPNFPSTNPNFPSTNPNFPPPNTNHLPDAMNNLQIGRPPPPSTTNPPPPGAPPPFSSPFPGPPPSVGHPSPPQFSQPRTPFASRPPPTVITSNGPLAGPQFPPASASQAPPPGGPPMAAFASGRPSPPLNAPLPFSSPMPVSLPGPPPSLARPSPAQFLHPQPPFASTEITSNGPPGLGGPRFPPAAASQHPPPGGPPMAALASVRPSPPLNDLPPVQSVPPFPGRPLPQTYLGPPQPFSGPQRIPGAPFAPPMWQTPPSQGDTLMSGTMQAPPRMFGMPQHPPIQSMAPVPPIMGHSPLAGAQFSTSSNISPNEVPRPVPSSSVVPFETRLGDQANIPPPATSNFIVKDNGNCSPRLMRCTISQIPCSNDLLSTSGMQVALMVQPLAVPHPSEDPIQIVDFGESGPLRCSRCKGYINPFMKFIDQGRRFICNLCGFTNETPRDYHCNLGPDGRRRDADERPELCRGTVEFVATTEYMVRDPMPAVFFFLIDVSMNAIQTGATAAACSAINQAIADLPKGPRTMVGLATFDSTLHFYNLKRALQQPLMLIVPDVQDVYAPLHTDLIVEVGECRQNLEQLLEGIPTMFENTRVAESAFGAAMKAAFLAMKPTGGKLLIFQSVLPSVGIGSLSARETEGRTSISSGDKEPHKLLQPVDKTLKTMAIEFAEYQVCVDIFITTQTFVDIASISVVPGTTGGQVYYYYPFSALSDSAKLYNDLRWDISRPQGFEAVMRVRCSQGLQVQEYSGKFCKHVPTDIDLPGIDCDKTIMVTFKHDDKFQDGSDCSFQCALLYTTVYGQRRIRVINLSLPCTNLLSNLFRFADLDTQFACFLKQAANDILASPLSKVREQMLNLCITILHSYRKFCSSVSSPGQLIMPEALKLLPLYTLALVKSIGLRNDGRVDDRSYWVNRVASLSITLAIPLVYPRMMSIHDLTSKEVDASLIATIPLSSEHVMDDGIYFLENGEDVLVYVGDKVNPDILQQLFGFSSVDGISTQLVLQQYDNELSKKLNDVVNEIRCQRCSYLRLRLCRKGDPSGMLFLSYMVEDKTPGGLSYVEFLVHLHRQIQTKKE